LPSSSTIGAVGPVEQQLLGERLSHAG